MKNKSNGFTLVELMVCIVLMGILIATFVPGLGMVYKQDVRKATELICSDLTMMRDQSKATGITYTLKTNGEKDEYTLSPSIIGNGDGRTGSSIDGINPNIRYELYKKEGATVQTPIGEVYYKAGRVFDSSNNSIDELIINILYSGDTRMTANIVYDGVTGHYKVTY